MNVADRCVIATDSEEVAAAARECGAEAMLTSADHASGTDRVAEVARRHEFAGFDEPGYAKIVWTLAAEPLGSSTSLFRTETRVRTTDPASRERFRRYWAVFSPGILLIRYESLRLVKQEAERRGRTDAGAPAVSAT